jgi:hypothetical protein
VGRAQVGAFLLLALANAAILTVRTGAPPPRASWSWTTLPAHCVPTAVLCGGGVALAALYCVLSVAGWVRWHRAHHALMEVAREVALGLGRIVALYYRSSTLLIYQIH